MKTIEQINKQIEKLQSQKKIIEEKAKSNIRLMIETVVINGIEYETKTHHFNKMLSEVQIPKGWRLWKASDFEKFTLADWDKLNIKDAWFFIEYPFAYNPSNYVSGFYADSDGAYLGCGWNPTIANSSLGVRFCRKKSGRKANNENK